MTFGFLLNPFKKKDDCKSKIVLPPYKKKFKKLTFMATPFPHFFAKDSKSDHTFLHCKIVGGDPQNLTFYLYSVFTA